MNAKAAKPFDKNCQLVQTLTHLLPRFSPSAEILAAACSGDAALLFDTGTGQALRKLPGTPAFLLRKCIFSNF